MGLQAKVWTALESTCFGEQVLSFFSKTCLQVQTLSAGKFPLLYSRIRWRTGASSSLLRVSTQPSENVVWITDNNMIQADNCIVEPYSAANPRNDAPRKR